VVTSNDPQDREAGRGKFRTRFPRLSRTLAIVLPLHIVAFVVLYLGLIGLIETEILKSYSHSAEIFSDQLVEAIHPVMEQSLPSEIRRGLTDFESTYGLVHLRIYDAEGVEIATGDQGDDDIRGLIAEENGGSQVQVAWNGERWICNATLSIVARGRCQDCHDAGEVLGAATFGFDITSYMSSARARMRRNIALMVIGWIVLVGLISISTRGLVQRSVARLRADVDRRQNQSSAEISQVSQILLDPLSTELYASLRKILASQRKREEQVVSRLHQANKLASLGELAAGLAHEIRNPLAGIQGVLEILRDEEAAGERRDLFGQMLAETERVNRTIESLLRFSRPVRPHLVATAIGDLLRDTVALLEPGLRKRRVTLEVSTAPELASFRLDREQIRQVVVNLVNNAAEAMSGGGKILLRATTFPDGDGLIIAVEDNGPGISAEVQEQIFEPFFTTKFNGTGLGLAVARALVNQHGGSIEVSSELGAGATFMVLLPGTASLNPEPSALEPNHGNDTAS
jgi:signal transduction histidine kinase